MNRPLSQGEHLFTIGSAAARLALAGLKAASPTLHDAFSHAAQL